MKKSKLILGRLALIVLGPLFFFAAVEVSLRFAGYGDPLTFFWPVEVDGRVFQVENPYFGQRFFRRHLPRVPAWNLVPPPTPGVPRIAVIGESAAQGYPLQKIGLASMLEGTLEIEHPGRRFDFINAAMTSVNSHVLADVVREVIAQKPDVAVFYMGNNEVVGPYGPGTPFTAWARNPWIVWLDKKLRTTRAYQLLESLLLSVSAGPKSWEGFQMFADLKVPADSPALQGVYRAFEDNLDRMVDEMLASGTRVLLCTVAVNLADWGPAASAPLPEGSAARPLLEKGKSLLAEGNAAEALLPLGQAAEIASGHAAAHFYLGRAREQTGDLAAARVSYERARDLDLHRFRADTQINNIIRRVAARHADRGVVLVDADRDLVAGELPGHGQFTEHVHMTFDGMKRLALLVAQALPPLLPDLGPPRDFTQADEAQLRDRIFFTPFDEVLLAVVARDVGEVPIFAGRPGAGETRDYWSAAERELRRSNPFDAAQLDAAFARSEALRPGDARNMASRADYLSRLGRTEEAAAAGQRVLARKPTYFEGYRFMADSAKLRGNNEEAGRLYRQALAIYRLIPDARKNLGDLARDSKDLRAAEDHYDNAFRMDAGNTGAALALAEIQANSSRRDAARQTLNTAAEHKPGETSVQVALAKLEAAEGNLGAARSHWETALALDPGLSPRELLRLVVENSPPAEAAATFARHEGRFGREHDLYNNYAWLLATTPEQGLRDPLKALDLARKANEFAEAPNAFYLGTLAAAFAANGDFGSALATLSRAREIAASDEGIGTSAEFDRMDAAFRGNQPYLAK